MQLLEPDVTFSTYADVQGAFGKRALSRSTVPEVFERGNILDGVVMLLHGQEHRLRRSRENPLFSLENLAWYEGEVFPDILRAVFAAQDRGRASDVAEFSGLVTVFMSAAVAGIDLPPGSIVDARRLVELDHVFNAGVGIEDYTGDPEELKQRVAEALREFERAYYHPSHERRQQAISRGELDPPTDLLAALITYRDELGIDDETMLRETAFFLESGSHTTAQTVTNSIHYLFAWIGDEPARRERVVHDPLFAQRCVQEALRLRPILPLVRRRVVEDTTVRGVELHEGDLVELDIVSANCDTAVFGDDAAEFVPDRKLPERASLVGHSFSAGMHSCIGRTLATGLPLRGDRVAEDDEGHLLGMAPRIVQELLAQGAVPDPDVAPEPITQSRRWTRWDRYPVVWRDAMRVSR